MSSEWAKVEITATTKQIKSAAQVEAEWRSKELAEINAGIDASQKRLNDANANLVGVNDVKKALGWDFKVASGANIDKGTRAVLDNATKSTSPIINSAEQNLRALSGGGFITNFTGVNVGEVPINTEMGKNLAKMLPTNLATTTELLKAGKISQAPGLVTGNISDLASNAKNIFGGGGGQSGLFNPAGVALPTETDPSGATYVKLAKTVFTSGTTIEAETVDIYGDTLNSPQNRVKSVLSDILGAANKGILGSLKNQLLRSANGSLNLSNITSNVNFETAKGVLDKYKNNLLSGIPLNQKDMLKDVYEAVGYDGKSLSFKGGLQGVGENMLKDIKNVFEGETGILSMYKSAKEVLDGDGDIAAHLFKIVGNFTENTKFAQLVGLDQQLDIITNVSKALVDMGAIEFLDEVIEKIDHKDRDKFIEGNLATGLGSGNVEFLKFALKHTTGAKILASYPDAISIIVSSFSPSVDVDGNITKKDYQDLVSCLSSIDPNWDNDGISHGHKIMDLSVFAKFNRQAKLAVLESGNREHISALISGENYAGAFDIVLNLQVRYPDYPII